MQSITGSLLAFTVAATLLTITPGLDTALVLRTAASEGPRRGLWSGLGIVTGCLIWAGSVAAGLGVLLLACLIAAMGPLTRWLRRPRVVRALDRATGAVFIAFGARLALESGGR